MINISATKLVLSSDKYKKGILVIMESHNSTKGRYNLGMHVLILVIMDN